MVISIGLMVDYLVSCSAKSNRPFPVNSRLTFHFLLRRQMHVILKYYECPGVTRDEKVKETLATMGASIFVGGFSTFLGVIPLAFSTSAILKTVCTAFFAMVTLGLTHGLIFLPVVLSLVGPLVCIQPNHGERESSELDNSRIPQTFTNETMAVSLVGSRASDIDAASTSSDDVATSLAKSASSTKEEQAKDVDLDC
jgi:Patched family